MECELLHWALLETIFHCLYHPCNLIFTAPTFTKSSLELAEQIYGLDDVVKTISKNMFQNFDNRWCRTDGAERCNFTRTFPAFSNGIMIATLQILGQWAREKDELNKDSNSWRAKGPSDLRNNGGMSVPAAPLFFTFLMAYNNSPIWKGAQLSLSVDGVVSRFYELKVGIDQLVTC